MAEQCHGYPAERQELLKIAEVCAKVPAKRSPKVFMKHVRVSGLCRCFYRQKSGGHSISPGRFDQYMYPYYEK